MHQNLQKSDAKCAKKCLPAASSSGPPCQPSPAAARRGGGAARQVAAGEVAPEKNWQFKGGAAKERIVFLENSAKT